MHYFNNENGERFCQHQPWNAKWSCAKSFEDEIRALESGGDTKADHGGGHDCQGNNSGEQEVDAALIACWKNVDIAKKSKQQHGNAEDEQQLLTIASKHA